MARIETTGNESVDQATAEIAVALRDAWPLNRDQWYYDEAMRLRDEIMKGTRELMVSQATSAGDLLKGTRHEGDPNMTVSHGVFHDKRYDRHMMGPVL